MAGDSTDTATQHRQPDTSGEFFTVGTPLHAIRAGYIRRKADEQLSDTAIAGRYAHVLAPERTGKTSLIAATSARLENNGFKVAVLDLAQIGVRDGASDAGRWYYNIAYRLMRQLRIRFDLQSWWHDKSILSNRQRLLEFYSEIILQFVPERVVVFVDEIQCIEDLAYADQLLASIRAAHNSRLTDPDFNRLVFVLMGECDPVTVVEEPELSPFSVTQQIVLDDFSRDDIDLFATELNLDGKDAAAALDRIFYWTRGQPYLSQKLARAITRDPGNDDIIRCVDRIATQQLAGRAALHSEPHMSHIHGAVVNDEKRREALLNLYGKIRKGIEVSADLGSQYQRRLIAIGLLVIDDDGVLKVRNRLYEMVFTARWANENLPINLRVPGFIIGGLVLLALIPFWYTQWLPRPYLDVLTSRSVDLPTAGAAYTNLRSFPGHADTADSFYRRFLEQRAMVAADEQQIAEIVAMADELPDAGRLPESIEGDFWDRRAVAAMHEERRDAALFATLSSLVMPTPQRRQRAAMLVGDDYPLLLATLPGPQGSRTVFDPVGMIVTSTNDAQVSQWAYAAGKLGARDDWTITALEVRPLVRRLIVDRQGTVNRVGLTLVLSHARLSDLRIKVIAPSGRTVEIETGAERASSGEEIRIGAGQLRDLVGESLQGTWSLSLRDERPGIAGQLVSWNLKLNSQGNVEDFQRGQNIPEPVERAADSIWFDREGRYAIARATQSDSARIWDLTFGEPVRAIAVNENEALVGLDAGARHLVTATQESVNLWDTASGARAAALDVGSASSAATLTADGRHLFVQRRSDVETNLELWSLEERALSNTVTVAGVPSLIAIDATGSRVATADYDRAVRIWDFATGALLAQFDLPAQPSAISLAAGGATLGVTYPTGISIWRVADVEEPLHQAFGPGQWRLAFSATGSTVLAGNPATGFQMYAAADGRLVGPAIGSGPAVGEDFVLAYSEDEQVVVTGSATGVLRFWDAGAAPVESGIAAVRDHEIWSPSGDRIVVALPGADRIAIGDPAGHVHVFPANVTPEELAVASEEVSFLGHNAAITTVASNRSGGYLASVAEDNTVRVWDADAGQPLSISVEIEGGPIERVAFSPDSSLLGVANASTVQLIRVEDGAIDAAFNLEERHAGLAFASDTELYVGADSGKLRLLARQADGSLLLAPIDGLDL